MGLQLPPEAIEALAYLGMTWPEADEELLLERGQQWLTFSEKAQEQRTEANHAVEQMLSTNESLGLKAFEVYWTRVGGDWGHLNGSAVTAQAIGVACIAAAGVVLAMKIAVIAQLIALAIVLVAAIAAALETLGASLAAAAAYADKVYRTIQRIIRAAIDAIAKYGPRLASMVGSLLEIVTKVVDSRPIHQGPDADEEPQSEADQQQAEAQRRQREDQMAQDPDHGGNETPNSRREAQIALDMEEAGLLPEPVTRPTGPGQGDIIDGNGTHWDIKGFRTLPGQRGTYNDAAAAQNIEKQIKNGRSVLLDTRHLSEADRNSLIALVKAHPNWAGKVVFY